MTRIGQFSPTLLLILILAACAGGNHEHGHEHGPGSQDHQHGPSGHDHVEASDAGHHDHDQGTETTSVAVTQWTDTMELFMEYPVLVAGEPGRFIIHLTILADFQPVRKGSVTLRFRGAGGSEHELVSSEVLREGIFAPTIRLPHPGAYEFDLSYQGPDAQSTFHVQEFRVFPTADVIPAAADDESGDEIVFLKEQQWKVPFATAEAEVREIKRAVWAIGEVMPAPTGYVEIVAPVEGTVQAADGAGLALPGSRVRRGDVVATISPPLQGESWVASRLAFEQAQRDFDRAGRLREKDAISQREYEDTRNRYLARKAAHEHLAGGGGENLTLNAPIDGQIIDWQVHPGQRVQAGDKLMAIADPTVVWLKVNVYQQDFQDLGVPVGAFIKADGASGGWTIPQTGLKVLTSGGSLDPVTRTVPVLLEVDNQAGRLTINESTPLELYASEGQQTTAVPRSAVYADDGLDVVFVQIAGEAFTKRTVMLGSHYAGWVSIQAGLQPGERVVTRGGYHVKLAATSVEIGHGHVH
jgi:RND family efflux transporter MFP subunit